MKRLLIALCFVAPSVYAGNDISAYYDTSRSLVIYEHSWFLPLGQWRAYGFNEFYRLPEQGFPPRSSVWFGKTWVMRSLTDRLSVGIEIEHGYNNAGMWTRESPFRPNQLRVLPKIGVSYKIN